MLQFGLYYILSWWCLINRHCHNDPRPIFTKWKDVLLVNVMKPRSRDIQFYNNPIALKPDRNLGSGAADGHTSEKALKLFPQTSHRWLNAKRTYLQCVSIRFTFLLHLAVDVFRDGKGWNGRDLCMPLTLEFWYFISMHSDKFKWCFSARRTYFHPPCVNLDFDSDFTGISFQ